MITIKKCEDGAFWVTSYEDPNGTEFFDKNRSEIENMMISLVKFLGGYPDTLLKLETARRFKFTSAVEMLDTITDGVDLYCPEEGEFVFTYNEGGSICVYHLTPLQAFEVAKKASGKDYWGAFMGVGGEIHDHAGYEYPDGTSCSTNENLSYCKDNFKNNWIEANYHSLIENKVNILAAKELWREFGDVPMDPETECIEIPWRDFEAGTHREEIWHWFEEYFVCSVAEDLMGNRDRKLINGLLLRTKELEAKHMTGDEEPEIGINEERKMITINKYVPNCGAFFIEDFCSVNQIDLNELRELLNEEGIAYNL